MEAFFGVPQAFVGSIESQGIGTLHVHMIVFLAGFPRDSDKMLEMMVKDDTFRARLIRFFSSVIFSSALDKYSVICPCCERRNSLEAVDICEAAYVCQTRSRNPFSTSQCKKCNFNEVLQYSVDRVRHELEQKGTEYPQIQAKILIQEYKAIVHL